MSPKEFREHLRKKPFKPFRVFLSDGSSHDVPHPEMALVTQGEISIAVSGAADEDAVPEKMVYCDPWHITRLEPIPQAEPKKRRPRSNGR
jgi:hypothetical protein